MYAAIIASYYLCARVLELEPRNQVLSTWRGPTIITVGLGALWVITSVLRVVYGKRRTGAEMLAEIRRRLWTWDAVEHVAGIFVLVAGVNVMFDVFAAFKPVIPRFHSYSWDLRLAEFDEVLHLGTPPWEWMAMLPAWDTLVHLLDRAYLRWYEVMTLTLLGVVAFAPSRDRLRFFFGYVGLWIIGGTVLGTFFASGGPVYYGELAQDPGRFAALLTHLDGVAPLARALQTRLWDAYVTPGGDFPFEGISAMPSLHVAVAVYLAGWGWRWGALAGIVGTLYALTILAGSVALGWHYAIDGYAGALLALSMHWAAERFVDAP